MKRETTVTKWCRNILSIALLVMGFAGTISAQSTNRNYVITKTIRVSGITNDSDLKTASIDKNKVQTEIKYSDGLGRPLQDIQQEASPLGNDIVQPYNYDVYGREFAKYLPYVPTTGAKGIIRTSVETTINAFYATPPDGVVLIPSSQVTYSKTVFEQSPLNRSLEQGFPGLNWKTGGTHTVRTTYTLNDASDAVKQWEVNSTGGAYYTKSYDVSTLNKLTAKDENGNTTIEFKDKADHVICRKVQNGSAFLTTDYIYDDFGNLRYTIPPLPTASGSNPAVAIPTSFTETDNTFLNYFYAYRYDGLKRVIEKKLPGQGWRYMVYNNRDQVILSQDANQKQSNIWMVNKYDGLDRVIINGVYYDATNSRQDLQNIAESSITESYETFTNANTFFGYTHVSWPDISTGANNKVLSVHYFDTYNIINNNSVNPSSTIFTSPSTSIDSLDKSPSGQITATLTNVLKSTSYMFTVMHYDNDGKLVKTISQNYQGLSVAPNKYDTEENTYGFQSQLIKSVRKHYLPVSTSAVLTINNWITYDHKDRPLLRKQQYITPTNTGAITTISKSEYNEIGQLRVRRLHSTDASANPANSTFLQHIQYSYNSRGWITKINDPTNLTDIEFATTTDVFAEQLDYDQFTTGYIGTVQYNGNVSALKWQTLQPSTISLPQETKGYIFTYDPLNRLTNATSKSTGTGGDDQYNETLTYDDLGNILSLTRKKGVAILNNMIYGYSSSNIRGNKLLEITDNGSVSEPQSTTYTYNNQGSLTGDTRKSITNGVEYNELGLPSKVTITSSNKSITYTYDSFGNKLARVTKTGGNIDEERVYDDDIEYSNGTIEFIQNNEGRVLPSTGTYIYEYNITDHLGNVRATFGDKNNNGSLSADEILQVVDYYAFGRAINYSQNLVPNPDNQYKLGSKEYQADLAEYDFGLRFYDPVIARWNVIDPASETARSWTPYRFGFDNPVKFTDALGLYEWTGPYGDSHDSKYEAGSVSFYSFESGSTFYGHNYTVDKNTGQKIAGTDTYYRIDNGGGDGGPRQMKVLYVYELTTPWIYEHINYAHKNLGKPLLLNYLGTPYNKDNRKQALREWRNYRRPFSWSVDEYPFASTLEGGAGASTALVPAIENSIQGGQLSALRLKKGDLLRVELVPNPGKERVPVLQTSPQMNYIPVYAPVTVHKSAIVAGTGVGVIVIRIILLALAL